VEKRLSSSPDGLSQVEAQKRLIDYGRNEIAEKKANPLLKLLTCSPYPGERAVAKNRTHTKA
jgi:hypothetical protein